MAFEGFESETWEALPGASRLTLAQREAIESEDPLLCVVAGAGAGKTRVLTLRVARRVRDGSIEADRALVTTFSRKAAEELRTRLWSLGVSGVKAGTFHRTALGLLREHRELRGRPGPSSCPTAAACWPTWPPATPAGSGPSTARSAGPRPASCRPSSYEAEARRHRRRSGMSAEQVADVYARYEAERSRRRLLDFDDLIVACADALAGDRAFADAVRWRTRHLFVDEMQDVNPAQFRLLTAMLADEPDLFVVGDPNQSVYGFNGADPTLLDRLPEILRGTKVIRLDENHRCTPQVVAVATAVLREGGAAGRGRDGPPRTTRVDGPVPRWWPTPPTPTRRPGRRSGPRCRAPRGGDGRASPCWPGPTPSWPRCRPPWTRPGAEPDRRSGPRPASDLRGDAGRRGGAADDDDSRPRAPADRDRVVLTTFHRAKGLQWPTVLVLGLGNGLMPMASAQTPARSTRSGGCSTWR